VIGSDRLGAEDGVDEIAKLCADLVVAGFIEPTTWHEVPKRAQTPSEVGRKAREKTRAGILVHGQERPAR